MVLVSFWTDEKKAECKELLAKGLSGLQIAIELGAPSRNAVISLIHRSGWTGPNSRGSSNQPPTNKRKVPRKTQFNFKSPQTQANTQVETPPIDPTAPTQYDVSFADTGPKILMELQAHDCRYPIGDPRKPDFCFCAATQFVGSPYCAQHTRIAYTTGV